MVRERTVKVAFLRGQLSRSTVRRPCNVVVRADGDHTTVQAIDPGTMVALTGLAAMEPVAEEAGRRLDAALATLTQPGA